MVGMHYVHGFGRVWPVFSQKSVTIYGRWGADDEEICSFPTFHSFPPLNANGCGDAQPSRSATNVDLKGKSSLCRPLQVKCRAMCYRLLAVLILSSRYHVSIL